MELRHLTYLLSVVEEGSFTRAAEKLYVSQPALSQQIKQLEDELGTPVLDRAGRRVRLNAAGEIFVMHARRVFQELDEAKIALQELQELQRGSLRVGIVQTVNAYLIPPVVARFTEAYPLIQLEIEELAAGEIEQALREGLVQLGVSFIPPTEEGLEYEELFNEELVLVIGEKHAMANCVEIEVSKLNGFPLVLLPKSYCTRRLWEECSQKAGIQARVVVEMNTIGAILSTIRQTKAGTILPRLALQQPYSQGLIGVQLCNPTPRRTVGLLWRRNAYRCRASQVFSQFLNEVILP